MTSAEARIGIMHIVDALDVGGAESMAVHLVNALPKDRFDVHLCTTRCEGPLARIISPDVKRLSLGRRTRIDLLAIARLARYIRRERIRIVHAHGTAVFAAVAARALVRRAPVIWHVHYGELSRQKYAAGLYRLLGHGVGGVIPVNRDLARWLRDHVRIPASRVWYVPNFVPPQSAAPVEGNLPGHPGYRIIHVANVRPEKDQLNAVRAMSRIVTEVPDAHLLIVGAPRDSAYYNLLVDEIETLHLSPNVSLLGERADVPAILKQCDIGLLSSAVEGLPVALIEYGAAGLPSVATGVGQCAEVLDHGGAGIVVSPRDPAALACALMRLLGSAAERGRLGSIFRRRVESVYSAPAVIQEVCRIYDTVLQA